MTTPTNILLKRQLRLLRSSVLVVLWTHLIWSKCFSIGATIGPSMLPTINASGDWVLISKFHTRGREVRVGDVVSFKHPHDSGDVRIIKRVIGLPGDFVVTDPSDGTGYMLQVRDEEFIRLPGTTTDDGSRYQRAICGLPATICRIRWTRGSTDRSHWRW